MALQTALAKAQQAYLDLSTGNKGESFSYAQGEGSKVGDLLTGQYRSTGHVYSMTDTTDQQKNHIFSSLDNPAIQKAIPWVAATSPPWQL